MPANKTQRKLGRNGSKQTLSGVVGDDVDDIDIYGYELVYTTGEFVVPRDQLLAKAKQVGIPEWMLPSETSPHYAFGRAMSELQDTFKPVEIDGQTVEFIAAQNDSRYSYSIDARVFFPAEMTTNDEGTWREKSLGVVKYDNPDSGEPQVRFIDRVDASSNLAEYWEAIKGRMDEYFQRHCESHIGKDVNNMTYYLVSQWTDSIKLRDACYFVPANHTFTVQGDEKPISDLIDAFVDLYEWLDQNADKPRYAQHTEMHVVEIMDTERQRSMVERKVEERLNDMASDMASSVIDRLTDEDTVASEVTDEVSETLDNLRSVAGEYDDLLDGGAKRDLKTKNAVKRAVTSSLASLDTDEQELVEEVLTEAEDEMF